MKEAIWGSEAGQFRDAEANYGDIAHHGGGMLARRPAAVAGGLGVECNHGVAN